jgi:hypothetical protein
MIIVGRLKICGPIRSYRTILVESEIVTGLCCRRLKRRFRVIFWARSSDEREFYESVEVPDETTGLSLIH